MTPPNLPVNASEDTGVTDVRRVRQQIAEQYHGDLRQHAADTDRLVAPLIEKLGLKPGTPPAPTPQRDARRSGTEG